MEDIVERFAGTLGRRTVNRLGGIPLGGIPLGGIPLTERDFLYVNSSLIALSLTTGCYLMPLFYFFWTILTMPELPARLP